LPDKLKNFHRHMLFRFFVLRKHRPYEARAGVETKAFLRYITRKMLAAPTFLSVFSLTGSRHKTGAAQGR
jgi:hypothetical protein